MAENSRSCKVWCVTLVSAVLVLVARTETPEYALIALIPAVLFLILDTYYLALERTFRESYNAFVRQVGEGSLTPADLYQVKQGGSIPKVFMASLFSVLDLAVLPAPGDYDSDPFGGYLACSSNTLKGDEHSFMDDIRNIFISHIHENDEEVAKTKDLLERHGMICRNGSITLDKFNAAHNEDYIKYQTLAPRINWSSVLVVYISQDTKHSKWVNWEIEYAHEAGKANCWRVGARSQETCELPEALARYHDAVVGWNGERIVDAINGT